MVPGTISLLQQTSLGPWRGEYGFFKECGIEGDIYLWK
jgi:hypothetical protein